MVLMRVWGDSILYLTSANTPQLEVKESTNSLEKAFRRDGDPRWGHWTDRSEASRKR